MTTRLLRARDRTILFAATPKLWPHWPFLPVVRRTQGKEELGAMFDLRGLDGRTGYSATVFLTNVFTLPPSLGEFLALPRETFDSIEELAEAGWRVD